MPMYVSPAPVFRICTEKEAMYVHAIFALKDEYNLQTLQAPFCTFVCKFFQVIENNWVDIVNDIGTGTIKTDLDIPSDVRSELKEILKADPIRAEQLRREFERGFVGIARRVWPYLSCLYGVLTPAHKLYADLLEKKYAKDVVVYSPFYICSEGLLGFNMWPKIPERKYHYLLFTELTFFEFIPLENSQEEQPETLLIDELMEDESYELVLTNIDGLYRFRFGDVIKVVGFYNKSPIIEIQFRIGDLMNLRGEKVSEDCLRRAILDTVASWEVDLVDYSCAECNLVEAVKGTTEPAAVPYYVVFVEIQSKPESTIKKELIDRDKLDIILRNQVSMYDYYRGMGSLGLAQVILVQSGSFNDLRDYIIHNSTTSVLQFKMPRKLRKNEWVELLLKNSS
ncbi:GH3 domain-containing protein-like [Amphiura filiformis]|uniref:GH3 domain-containing protein-like n=1 Tax=Amphiura filiformis TaxID=82378 RepID=UPI003B21BF7C